MDAKKKLGEILPEGEVANDNISEDYVLDEATVFGEFRGDGAFDANGNEATASTLSMVVYVDDPEETPALYAELKEAWGAYGANVDVIEVTDEGGDISAAFKSGLGRAKGEYVCFIHSDTRYTKNAVADFLCLAKTGVSIFYLRPTYVDPKGKVHYYLPKGTGGIVDLAEQPASINLCLESYFFDRNILTDAFFTRGCTEESRLFGLIRLLEQHKRAYYLSPACSVVSTASFNDAYNYSEQYEKEWYTRQLMEEFIPLLDETNNSPFVQNVVSYLLSIRFLCNWNDRNKSMLGDGEVDTFYEAVHLLLQKLDDEVIIEKPAFGYEALPKYMRYHLLEFKHRGEDLRPSNYYTRTNMVTTYNDSIVGYKPDIKFFVYAINYEGGQLIFDARLTNTYCLVRDKLSASLRIDEHELAGETNEIYSLNKFFGRPVEQAYTFQVRVPEELFTNGAVISAYCRYDGHPFKLEMTFGKIASRLSPKFGTSYWCFGDWIMRYNKKPKMSCIVVEPCTKKLRRKYERALEKDYFHEFTAKKDFRALKSIALRKLYFLTRPLFKGKKLWMIFDQLFKGGDNGEYLFRYAMDHGTQKDIVPYYIINKDAVEYPELKKKYGRNVVVFNSIRCKLLTLHAAVIFATRVDIYLYCGYAASLEKYVRGLCNAHVICLQHGLTIQRIAQYQNRLFDNTRKYFLVSPLEKENVSHRAYGYDEDMLVMTGAPRFDGLVSRDKKQILITPTWRRNVTAGTNSKGSRNEYSVNFKHTEYFRIYNSLINDERVVRTAKETGYKLIYLIHPILSPQIGDYTVNENVEIIPGSEVNYETILSESSLMLTDYSGIQFDFAYMRKPVLYYHPDTLPPQYDSSIYDYETKALGPVFKTHEAVVEALCRYMRNNCRMEEEYEKRVNSFYAFSDRENSRRAYEEGVKYTREHFE